MSDLRISAAPIRAPAGLTQTWTIVAQDPDGDPFAITSLSVWLGGDVTDLDDLTDATEHAAVISGDDDEIATVEVDIPTVDEIDIRVVVDGLVEAVDTLHPSSRGTTTPTDTIVLTRSTATFTLTVRGGSAGSGGGAHPDLSAHDALGLATDAELAAAVAVLQGVLAEGPFADGDKTKLDGLTDGLLTPLVVSGDVTLTAAEHNGRIILPDGAHTITVDSDSFAAGQFCVIANLGSGATLAKGTGTMTLADIGSASPAGSEPSWTTTPLTLQPGYTYVGVPAVVGGSTVVYVTPYVGSGIVTVLSPDGTEVGTIRTGDDGAFDFTQPTPPAATTVAGLATAIDGLGLVDTDGFDAALLDDISGLTVSEGDVLYVDGSGDIVNLGAGDDDDVLTLASGVPSWAAPSGGGGGDMVAIDEVLVGAGGVATIDFTSISQSYRHLLIEAQLRGSTAATTTTVLVQLNGDTGTNWNRLEPTLTTAGASAAGAAGATGRAGYVPAATADSGHAGLLTLRFPNYRGTTFEKQVLCENAYAVDDATSNYARRLNTLWWKNTAAITRITLVPSSGFVEGSVATLYGLNPT